VLLYPFTLQNLHLLGFEELLLCSGRCALAALSSAQR
jgi:hypothetical protein